MCDSMCTFLVSADFTSIACRAPDAARMGKEVPPYNGFGSEEDSLCSTK